MLSESQKQKLAMRQSVDRIRKLSHTPVATQEFYASSNGATNGKTIGGL